MAEPGELAPLAAPATENEPSALPAELPASDQQSYGQTEPALLPQGVAMVPGEVLAPGVRNGAPKRPAGVKGKSGPPRNMNAMKSGASTVRNDRKLLLQRAINGRTSEGRFVNEQRAEMVAHLGGDPTTPQRYYVDEVAFLRLQLAYFRAFLVTHPAINKKKRTATPLLRDYLAMVATLQKLLSDLGLERRERDVTSLAVYLASKTTTATADAPQPAVAPPSAIVDDEDPAA